MRISEEIFVELHFSLKGTFFILSVDVVDLFDGVLVASPYTHLLALGTLLSLGLLLVELLQFLPELVCSLFLVLPLPLLILFILPVCCFQMFLVNISIFCMLSFDILLVLYYFLNRRLEFLVICSPTEGVLLFFPAVELELIGGTLNGVVDLVSVT